MVETFACGNIGCDAGREEASGEVEADGGRGKGFEIGGVRGKLF